jgi:NAD(P)-dependent dehydrogenase (short-subunit alcohol dehydrogenase family)
VIDRQEGEHFVGDIADKDTLERFAKEVIERYGHVGNPMDIANMVLYLCSDKAGFITGENICIDGGMTRQMIYHGDNGWKLELSSNVV